MRFTKPLLLLCASAALAPPALAQEAIECAVPTIEECTSDSRHPSDPNRGFWGSFCGRFEERRAALGAGACSQYVSQEIVDAAAIDNRIVYLPPNARKTHGALAESTGGAYSYASHYSHGSSGNYAHLLQRSAIAALVQGLDLLSLPDRLAWHTNGNAVASCDEYVYEKFYDYSAFEDSVAVAGDDARAVFDLAYAPGNIGDRARNGLELASKSRNTTHYLSWFGLYPKNVYFEFDGRYPMGQDGNAYPMDADIKARVAAAERKPHDFSWHFEMSQALAGQPDDLLYAMEEKQAEFAKLLELRKTIFEKWHGAFKRWADGVGRCAIEVPPGQLLPDPMIYINPPDYRSLVDLYSSGNPVIDVENPVFSKVIDASNIPQVVVPVQPGIPGGIGTMPGILINQGPVFGPIIHAPILGGISKFKKAKQGMQLRTHSAAAAAHEFDLHEDFSVSATGDGDCTQMPDLVFDCSAGFAGGLAMVNDYGQRVARCLKLVDEKIEVSLKEARQDGCLDPSNPTACDWSPRVFVRELQGRTLSGKEESYARCTRFTGGDFGPNGLIQNAQNAGISGQTT